MGALLETMNGQSRKATAIHEAGHAVIGRVLGLLCGCATIIPNESKAEAGYSICADPWATLSAWEKREKFRDARSAFCGRILAYMAGAESERELLGQCPVGDGDDRYQIAMMAESCDSGLSNHWEQYEPRMRRQTRRLVRKHRDKIERIARALLERETLEAHEIDALI